MSLRAIAWQSLAKKPKMIVVLTLFILGSLGAGCTKVNNGLGLENYQEATDVQNNGTTSSEESVALHSIGVRAGCFPLSEAQAIFSSVGATNVQDILTKIKNKEKQGYAIEGVCLERNGGDTRLVALLNKSGYSVAAWSSEKQLPLVFSNTVKENIMYWGNGDDMIFVDDQKDSYGFTVTIHSFFAEGLDMSKDYFSFKPGTKTLKKTRSCDSHFDIENKKETETCK